MTEKEKIIDELKALISHCEAEAASDYFTMRTTELPYACKKAILTHVKRLLELLEQRS